MPAQRLFRFGVMAAEATSSDEWQAIARKAEMLNYSTLLVPDHFVNFFSPVAALMAAADATERLRVGSFVFANDFRHPALLAKDIATLDVLSKGRFELGIGAGWLQAEYEQLGIAYESAGIRISRLEEALHIIRGLLSEESVTFSGNYYAVNGLEGRPRPIQQPYPPIFIGGGGKRQLTMAAREADIVGIHFKARPDGKTEFWERSLAGLAQKVEWVRLAAGTRFEAIELNLLVSQVAVTGGRQESATKFAREMPFVLLGSVDQIVEDLLIQRERYHISYIVIYEKDMEMFAPVVAKLSGK